MNKIHWQYDMTRKRWTSEVEGVDVSIQKMSAGSDPYYLRIKDGENTIHSWDYRFFKSAKQAAYLIIYG